MTTPPLPRPAGSYDDDSGFTHQGNADPQAWEAFVADQKARADLGPRTAIDILTGGVGFAPRGALGAGGGRLRATGQIHHAISRRVFGALEKHRNLKGHYRKRDPRFETTAADLSKHNGYWGWHEDLDAEVVDYIDTHPDLTPKTFESYLRRRYAKPDLKVRFPNGLPRK
jgi:hypothetical protein